MGRVTRVVNKRYEDFDVYIGRGSIWGNQYTHPYNTKSLVIVGSREEAIELYRLDLVASCNQPDPVKRKAFRAELASLHGKTLGCYCAPLPCHGDVLAVYAAKAHAVEIMGELIEDYFGLEALVGPG